MIKLTDAELTALKDMKQTYDMLGEVIGWYNDTKIKRIDLAACESLVEKHLAIKQMINLDELVSSESDPTIRALFDMVCAILPNPTSEQVLYQISEGGLIAMDEIALEQRFKDWQRGL